MPLKSYRELEVWQTAVDLVEAVYVVCRDWPDSERFGLISQAQRAAVSIPANIAEGYGRSHRGDYLRHLSIARGSLAELDTHLIIAHRLGYISREKAKAPWQLSQRVGRMLTKQVRSLAESELPARVAVSSTRTPNPETRTPKPQTRAPKPQTRNPIR